jgi:hypothetical protein
MKTYTIAPRAQMSVRVAGGAYVGALGTLWLLIEPLGTLGLIPQTSSWHRATYYVVLLTLPGLAVLAGLRWWRWKKEHEIPCVMFSIGSASDGVTYQLRVARNMQVSDVLLEYIDILRRGPARARVDGLSQWHSPVLQLKRSGIWVDVPSDLTIEEAGLSDGEKCQVRAERQESVVLFSRRPVVDDAQQSHAASREG